MIYLITGAGRGIGFELTRLSLKAGNEVYAVVRNPEKYPKLNELSQEYKALHILKGDVTSVENLKKIASTLSTVDVLINNAGVYLDNSADFETLDMKLVTDTFEVNSIGPMKVAQAFLPLLLKSSGPKLINITSLMGSIEDNGSGGAYAYRMSKTALNMFTKSFANDFAKITAICVHPGWVQTDMGGASAPTTTLESATGILKLAARVGKKESGQFFDFEGDNLPW